jgi:hypothetical protein
MKRFWSNNTFRAKLHQQLIMTMYSLDGGGVFTRCHNTQHNNIQPNALNCHTQHNIMPIVELLLVCHGAIYKTLNDNITTKILIQLP